MKALLKIQATNARDWPIMSVSYTTVTFKIIAQIYDRPFEGLHCR
jgi:hypothetical protein